MSAAPGTGVYLATFLKPLAPWLERPDVTDIFINQPGVIFVETCGGATERVETPLLTEATLWRLAAQIAALSHQGISRQNPILSATLTDGARVQIVAPPATRGPIAMAIRKQVMNDLSLSDYASLGALRDTATTADGATQNDDDLLQALLDRRDLIGFLIAAVKARKNILISGGTSTGKTTFLNALIKEIPHSERLITIEDTPEVLVPHPNSIGLIATRGDQGEARVSAEDLLQASLRLRPDRIILGELRGVEAYSFLRAVNSGHPGSITTVHADTPDGAIEQIALMVMQSGMHFSGAEIRDYVRGIIDVTVQLSRQDGQRKIAQIGFRRRT